MVDGQLPMMTLYTATQCLVHSTYHQLMTQAVDNDAHEENGKHRKKYSSLMLPAGHNDSTKLDLLLPVHIWFGHPKMLDHMPDECHQMTW
jgi:hypothetical protein